MSVHKVVEGFPTVPRRFTRRVGDWAQEGGNNTLIVMGTDRAKKGPATVDDGLGTIEADGGGKKTGAIHLVVGRKDQNGDPDFSSDDAFIYLAQRTNADDNLASSGVETATKNQPAAVVKSTDVRISFGGPGGNGSLKVFFDDQPKKKYLVIDKDKARLSMAPDSSVTLSESTCEVKIGTNKITISSDGSITIDSDNSVKINTGAVEVTSDTAYFSGDVTIQKSLTVVAGLTSMLGNALAPTLTVGSIVTTSATPVSVPSGIIAGGDIIAAGKSLSTHTHLVPAVKAGPDTVTTIVPT